MSALPVEYRHEPSRALAAGADGLDVVDRILPDAHKHMTAHGILVVEAGNCRTVLETKYPRTPFVWPDLEHGGEGVFMLSVENLRSMGTELNSVPGPPGGAET